MPLDSMRSRIERISRVVEGFNNKLKLTTRKAYGYSTVEITLYQTLGALPEPESTDKVQCLGAQLGYLDSAFYIKKDDRHCRCDAIYDEED